TPPRAQEPVKVKMSRLTFPSLSTLMIDVVKAKGIDKKHGIDLEGVPFSAISGYYAGLATGEVDMLAGGPHVAQKMILEGVPISIAFTWHASTCSSSSRPIPPSSRSPTSRARPSRRTW